MYNTLVHIVFKQIVLHFIEQEKRVAGVARIRYYYSSTRWRAEVLLAVVHFLKLFCWEVYVTICNAVFNVFSTNKSLILLNGVCWLFAKLIPRGTGCALNTTFLALLSPFFPGYAFLSLLVRKTSHSPRISNEYDVTRLVVVEVFPLPVGNALNPKSCYLAILINSITLF